MQAARLGTNPWAIAVPSDLKAPLFLDMATSAVAVGKVKLAEARGQPIPRGWVVDSEGQLTTDPKRLSQGGALLPLGGPGEGYKGTGLAAIGEILCGILTGLGFGVEPSGRHNDGCFLLAIKVDAFRPLADANVNIDMIVQNVGADGSTDMTFTVGKADLARAQDVLGRAKAELGFEGLLADPEVAKISVVGIGMRSHAGVANTMFRALAEKNINIQVISTSEIKVSVLVGAEYTELAVRALHTAYGLDGPAG